MARVVPLDDAIGIVPTSKVAPISGDAIGDKKTSSIAADDDNATAIVSGVTSLSISTPQVVPISSDTSSTTIDDKKTSLLPAADDGSSIAIDASIPQAAPSNNDSSDSAGTKKATASSLPFPKDGIRLSSLKDFYDACGGKDKLLGLTIIDVNEKYQKPITARSELSYCEYLKKKNSINVGQAAVFISHGKYPFLLL